MKKPLPKSPLAGLRTWQQIGQRAAGRPFSPVARRKRIIRGLGVMATLLMAGGLGLLGEQAWKLYQRDPVKLRAADSDARLLTVDFQTNGVLTEDWARTQLGLKNGDLLPQYDLYALRKHLLETSQVREAYVERVLPDTLRLRLTERQPFLRLAVADGAGGYKPYLVARDGTIYEGQLYSDDILKRLPWAAGLKLHRQSDGSFPPVAGVETVEDLLTQAVTKLPKLTPQWTVVDLSDFDPRPQAALSLIRVRTQNLGDVVFLAHDFHRQLDRLAVIAQDLQDKQITPKGVDLSLDQQAVVELATTPPPAHATAHSAAAHTHPPAATTFAQTNVSHSFSP